MAGNFGFRKKRNYTVSFCEAAPLFLLLQIVGFSMRRLIYISRILGCLYPLLTETNMSFKKLALFFQIEECKRKIKLAIDGLHYYRTYDRMTLW